MKKVVSLSSLITILIYNCIFGQTLTVCIPYGKSAFIDGVISAGEWDDADSVQIVIDHNWITVVKYKHDSLNLYFAYLGHLQSAGRVPEVVLDLSNDKSLAWQTDDWWFHVSATDCESQGTPNNFNNCQIVQPGWEGVPNMTTGPPFTDTIEIRISFAKIGLSLSDTIGIAFNITNTFNEWNCWPSGANINNPFTWATAYFCNNQPSGIYHTSMSKDIMVNYPNPFNSSTTIRFSIPKTEHVTLKVFDVLGREVATLVNEELNPGEHSVVFEAKDLPSGVYFYRLRAGNFVQQRKMTLIK